jgi:phosphoribosylformylglycinamidine cyclo-ligase
VHAFAHITGGGLPDNIARVLPDDCDAIVHRGTWTQPRIFDEIQAAGAITDDEMEHVFNLGVGMIAVVAADDSQPAIDALAADGHDAFVIGEIIDGHGRASVVRR